MHITELRSALNQVLAHLGLPEPAYSQFVITPGVTKLRLADVQELRDAIY